MWRELTGNSSEVVGSSSLGGRELAESSAEVCWELAMSSPTGDQELVGGSLEGCREFTERSIDKINSGYRLASSEEGSRVDVDQASGQGSDDAVGARQEFAGGCWEFIGSLLIVGWEPTASSPRVRWEFVKISIDMLDNEDCVL
ncbi:hypothetical protein BHM03_00010401 [Ensete ventricosum]|nr:hypothetical protein BHM03_00010401 [Ensete ventricosum]